MWDCFWAGVATRRSFCSWRCARSSRLAIPFSRCEKFLSLRVHHDSRTARRFHQTIGLLDNLFLLAFVLGKNGNQIFWHWSRELEVLCKLHEVVDFDSFIGRGPTSTAVLDLHFLSAGKSSERVEHIVLHLIGRRSYRSSRLRRRHWRPFCTFGFGDLAGRTSNLRRNDCRIDS